MEQPHSLSHCQITHLSHCHSLNQSRLPSRPHLSHSPGKRKPIKQDSMVLSITTSIFLILIIITTSSSEDSVALLASPCFAKVRHFRFVHKNKRCPYLHYYYHFRFLHTNKRRPHPHNYHHLLIRRLSCSLGLVLCVTTSLHLCVKLKLLLVQSPRISQYMNVWESPFGIIAQKFPKECSARSSFRGKVAQFRVSDRLQKLTLQILCRPRCIVAFEAQASSTTSSCPSSPSPSRSPSRQRPTSPPCSSCPSSSPSSRSRRGTTACEILPAQLVPS